MPIWFELVVMLLATYAIGAVIGWALWGREITAKIGGRTAATTADEETF